MAADNIIQHFFRSACLYVGILSTASAAEKVVNVYNPQQLWFSLTFLLTLWLCLRLATWLRLFQSRVKQIFVDLNLPRIRRRQMQVTANHLSAHTKRAWVRTEVLRFIAIRPCAGCRTIAATFNSGYGDYQTVGKTYVDNLRKTAPHEWMPIKIVRLISAIFA
jgi:hypothetical protein